MLILNTKSPSQERACTSNSGLTLVDLMIATTIMVIGVLGTVGTLQTTSALSQSTRETTVAYQAARAMLEDLQSQPFQTTFRRYNADETDDPVGAVDPSPGEAFQVTGMTLQALDADGFAGQIFLPVDELGVLREDLEDASFGMPRDLNGDGVIDGANRNDDHILLPIRVRVEWNGNTGDRFIEFNTILCQRE